MQSATIGIRNEKIGSAFITNTTLELSLRKQSIKLIKSLAGAVIANGLVTAAATAAILRLAQ